MPDRSGSLPSFRSISNRLGASGVRQNGEHSDAPVKGYSRAGQFSSQPTCDRCFKELFDGLTSLPPCLSPPPLLSPPCCFPFSAALIKPGDPNGRLWFPGPHCCCSEVSATCPHRGPANPTSYSILSAVWLVYCSQDMSYLCTAVLC